MEVLREYCAQANYKLDFYCQTDPRVHGTICLVKVETTTNKVHKLKAAGRNKQEACRSASQIMMLVLRNLARKKAELQERRPRKK